ncbi:hypothetical protein Tco_0634053 [Tanacetum coccineum]
MRFEITRQLCLFDGSKTKKIVEQHRAYQLFKNFDSNGGDDLCYQGRSAAHLRRSAAVLGTRSEVGGFFWELDQKLLRQGEKCVRTIAFSWIFFLRFVCDDMISYISSQAPKKGIYRLEITWGQVENDHEGIGEKTNHKNFGFDNLQIGCNWLHDVPHRRVIVQKKTLVAVEEPVKKLPRTAAEERVPLVFQIGDTHGVSVSKKKAPTKAKRSKGVELMFEAALLEEAQLEKAIKRSKQETDIHHAGGSSEGAGLEPEVPDEQKGKSIDTIEGTGLKPGVPD